MRTPNLHLVPPLPSAVGPTETDRTGAEAIAGTTTDEAAAKAAKRAAKRAAKDARRDAKLAARRAEALRRFSARYRHKLESLRAMVGSLRRIAATHSGGEATEVDYRWDLLYEAEKTQEVMDAVAARYAKATVTRDASALRIMLKHCRNVGLLTHEQYQHARDFEVRGGEEPAPPGSYLGEEDMVRIIRSCEHGTGGVNTRIRDVALLLTLASSGMRGFELSYSRMKNLRLEQHRIWLTRTKSAKGRWAYLHPTAVAALRRWLEIRGTGKGPLFLPLSRTGRPMHEHGRMCTKQIWRVVKGRAAEAGFTGIAPHDLRRFLITSLLDHVDLVLVADTVGHVNPQTTAGYDRRPAERRREAVATLRFPSAAQLGLDPAVFTA